MARESYTDKLRRPEWQRKRLEILQRDGFACTNCGDTNEELHVHHAYYSKGLEPWEYNGNHLRTLCKTCHGRIEKAREQLLTVAGDMCGGQWALAVRLVCYASSVEPEEAKRIADELDYVGHDEISAVLLALGMARKTGTKAVEWGAKP